MPDGGNPSTPCGITFLAWDGPQKCGRVAGHPGAHTRDPIILDASALPDGEAERIASDFPGVEFREATDD